MEKDRFLAVQQWLRIEKRSIIKEYISILVKSGHFMVFQTIGGSLYYEGAFLLGRIRYGNPKIRCALRTFQI